MTLKRALANGRYNRQAGDKERLVANQQNGTVVPEMDSETQTTRRPTDVWNGSAGRGGIGVGVGAGQSRRPQVNYSRHLHGGVDGGPSTAGNSVRVELHDHERGTMRQGQLPLDDDLLLIEGGPSDHKTGQQQQRRYRLGTQYEDLEDQLEEIIVIDDRDGGAGTSTQRLPVRRIRRIVKRSPSRGQIDEYEEWGVEHPASLPEWYDGGDELVRRGIDGDNRRVIVRKYPGAGGGSLPGDLRQEGAWFNGGGGVHRQTPEVAGHRNRRNGEAFRASQRSRVRPRHRHFRDRSMTRGANSLRLDDGDSVEEAEVEAEDQLEEDDLIDFDEGRSQFRHQRVAFEEPAGRSSRSRRQNRGPTSYLRSSTNEDMMVVQRPRPKGNQGDQDDEDDQRTKPKRNKDRQDDEQRARPKGNKGHQDDEDDDEYEEADEDNDDEERADVTASKSKQNKKTHQSRAVSARPLSQDAVTVAEATMSKLDQVTIPETKDSSTSPKLPPPPPAGPNPELEESPQSSPSHVLQSEDKSEESPDNVPLKAANSNRRKAKRESRYMDWYKNIERGVDGKPNNNASSQAAIAAGDNSRTSKRRRKLSPSDGDTFDDELENNLADEASHQRSRLIQQQSMMSRQRRGSDPSPHQRRKSRLRSPTTTSFDGNDKTTTKRSDTALDVLEAQMRLGGRDQDDDEEDSGIGHAANDTFRSSRKQFLEKKSLFTIAYNQNKQDALKDRDSSANNAPDNRIT